MVFHRSTPPVFSCDFQSWTVCCRMMGFSALEWNSVQLRDQVRGSVYLGQVWQTAVGFRALPASFASKIWSLLRSPNPFSCSRKFVQFILTSTSARSLENIVRRDTLVRRKSVILNLNRIGMGWRWLNAEWSFDRPRFSFLPGERAHWRIICFFLPRNFKMLKNSGRPSHL